MAALRPISPFRRLDLAALRPNLSAIFLRKEGNRMTDLPNEEWREVQDYPHYFVSNLGRIKSTKRGKPHLLTTFVNNHGYPRVALCKDG